MKYIFVVLFCFFSMELFAQQPNSRAELEKRRQSILESIKETQAQLDETKKDKNATMGQLRALQLKLDARKRLINNINEEIGQINSTITTSSQEVSHLSSNLDMLKMRYAQSIRYAYKNRNSYNMLAFLFSSNDFNQAFRRVKYLKKYRDYRQEQANQIRNAQDQLKSKINVLNNQKQQKNILLVAEEEQRKTIQSETEETNNVVKELRGREKELMASIEKNKKASKQLDNAIAAAIRKEIEIARKKAEEEARQKRLAEERKRQQEEEEKRKAAALASKNAGSGVKLNTGSSHAEEKEIKGNTNPAGSKPTGSTPPVASNTPSDTRPSASASSATPKRDASSYALSLTPEVALISNNFEANRGRLSWPVSKGQIVERFGTSRHPVYKVEITNNGVEILTNPRAAVLAVFEGTVTGIINIPGMGQSVMVSHGQYFTVYSRLGNVTVSRGDQIKARQVLGNISPNDDGENLMHFEVWKVGKNNIPAAIDPSSWLAPM